MKNKVSDCHGAALRERFIEKKEVGVLEHDGYDCSVCSNDCVPVNEEDQFWDASLARNKECGECQGKGGAHNFGCVRTE